MIGAIIGTKHTDTWGLRLKQINVSMPAAKTMTIDIPGADGILDLSEILSNDIKYGNRDIELVFDLLNDYYNFPSISSDIANFVHGRKHKIILDTDPSFYYLGRLQIDNKKSDFRIGEIVISGDVEPYKFEKYSGLEEWLWDDFNFNDGIIREYKDLIVIGTLVLNIPGRRKKISPIFITNSIMTVTFNSIIYQLPIGSTQVLDIELLEGDNILTFSGNGTASVDYRGGSL